MSDTTMGLRERIAAACEAVRRDGVLAMVAAGAVTLCVVAALAIALGAFAAWRAPSPLPLLMDLALIATLVGGGLYLRRRWLDAVDETRIAGEAERVVGLPAGAVRGALELIGALPPGASPALARVAEERARVALEPRPTRELGGALAERARRRTKRLTGAFAVGAVALAAAGFAMPDASARGVGPLLDPIGHLSSPPLPPVRVAPGNATVPRGDTLAIAVDAPQRTEAVIRYWSPGVVQAESHVDLGVSGGGVAGVGPIDAVTRYVVVTPDGAASDTFTIEPVDPLMLAELTIEARYPAYLEREPEQFMQPVPALELPEGTELRIRALATSELSSAELLPTTLESLESGVASAASVPLVVSGSSLAGTWRPTRSGDYRWEIRDAADQPLAVEPEPLAIAVVADTRPTVRVTFPATDTIVPAGMRLEVVADAEDDYGIATAEIVSWRISSLGRRDEPVRQSIGLGGSPDRALLRGILDIGGRGMMPGDTLKYLVRVVDNSPRAQAAESRTYALVFPGMSDLREEVVDEAGRLVQEASELARRAEELSSEVRDASRRMRSEESSRGGESSEQSMSFGEADRLERLAEQDREMLREVEEMTERLESLERAMEAAGLQDPQLQEQLDELRELYESVLTDELREQIEELQRGLDELDPEQVQQALERLAEQQEQMRDQLERSMELFRRAATEQEMSALAQDAREMAGREEAIAAAMSDSATAARAMAEQRALEADAQQLEQRLGELAAQLEEMGEDATAQEIQQAQQQAQSAQQQMSQAQQQARQGQNQQAQQQAQQAAQDMAEAAEQMDQAREEMAGEWREEAAEAVQQATQDVLSLAQEQEALRQKMEESARSVGMPSTSSSGGRQQGESRSGMQADQAAIQQGLEAMGRNLSEAGQRSAMVSREVGAALGRGMVQMDRVQEQLAEGNAALPVDQARQAVEAMNQLAMELLANADRIAQSEQGTGLQQALEQMAQMAQEQGAVNAQANAMMPLALGGAQMQAQAQRLAQRQQQIGEGLDQVQRDMGDRGDVLGRVDELAAEAQEIAEQLQRDGVRPETLARQERLFHRLLDAGRTLERDETSEERRAERPGEVGASRVAPLDPSATRGPLYPPPSEEELRKLSPAYRRLILDYFDRLNRAAESER